MREKTSPPTKTKNESKETAVLCQALDLTGAAIEMDPFLDRSVAFKRDFNKFLYTMKWYRRTLEIKAKGVEEGEDSDNEKEVVRVKETDTKSGSKEESESKSKSKS